MDIQTIGVIFAITFQIVGFAYLAGKLEQKQRNQQEQISKIFNLLETIREQHVINSEKIIEVKTLVDFFTRKEK